LTILHQYKDLLSTDDLSEIFGVSKQTVYKQIQQGNFGDTVIKIGRSFRIPKIAILNQFFSAH